MKAKDIKTGVVYAYRRGRIGQLRAIVFVAPFEPSHLYSSDRYAAHGTPAWQHRPGFTKPRQGGATFDPSVGYLAVTTRDDTTPAELLNVTLEDVLALKSDRERAGLNDAFKASVVIVTSPTYVLGPYEEVAAKADAEEAAERKRLEREREKRETVADRALRLVGALGECGVKARFNGGDIVIGVSEFEALAALVRSFTEEKTDG